MRLYIFLDNDGNIIDQVRAENHDEAIKKASSGIDFNTDFYSTDTIA